MAKSLGTKGAIVDGSQADEESTYLKLKRSPSRNELSRGGVVRKPLDIERDLAEEKPSIASLLGARFMTTLEVGISKIFMAGFGWQTASVLAESWGYGGDTLGFALMTGGGDFCGVFAGHSAWMIGKSLIWDNKINVSNEIQVGFLLGSAAFCSGTLWQPLVNTVQAAGFDFNTSAAAVWVGCGLAFFGGLRAGRTLYSKFLPGVEKPNYANLKADAGLSVSVGAATGAFVGTDISYGDMNWLRPVVGVEDGMSDIHGEVLAGTSTFLGFAAVQSAQNVTVSPSKNWVD